MRFSLKLLLAVTTWLALLTAALILDSPVPSELFIWGQMFVVAVGIASVATCERRQSIAWKCFLAGFLTCYALFVLERHFNSERPHRQTLIGARLESVASWVASRGEYPHPFARGRREAWIQDVLRYAVCGATGLLTLAAASIRRESVGGGER